MRVIHDSNERAYQEMAVAGSGFAFDAYIQAAAKAREEEAAKVREQEANRNVQDATGGVGEEKAGKGAPPAERGAGRNTEPPASGSGEGQTPQGIANPPEERSGDISASDGGPKREGSRDDLGHLNDVWEECSAESEGEDDGWGGLGGGDDDDDGIDLDGDLDVVHYDDFT
eukprot:g2982.t1